MATQPNGCFVSLVAVVVIGGASMIAGECSQRARQDEARRGVEAMLATPSKMAKDAAVAVAGPAFDAASQADEMRAREAAYAELPLAERVRRAKASCADAGTCPTDESKEILEASKSDAERAAVDKALEPLVARAKAKAEKAEEAQHKQERDWLAESWDQQLLDKHMNPDGVHAYGKTLHFDGWFCSRQFVHDVTSGGSLLEEQGAGFKRVECSNGIQTWTQEL